ncbi:MAG: UDP-galactopyranose mutase [Novosphingobium lindaniclasticum]|uniref:UDP-galactopyranose mutase n=1 Tax=Novosphingobium lindaniclasticum TaxID=1329895 RepID=UPI0024091A50|nr:UDP-galactopyranose mutase [Novosphingobium lindaniclasticum]MDF2639406.1 UDP-galactopyranose mutase [Novosphingobium lindaniclasticum]
MAYNACAGSGKIARMGVGDLLIICFSHLRWDFVFQRPQHLMTRLAASSQVVFWEEPMQIAGLEKPRLSLRPCPASGVTVACPELPEGLDQQGMDAALRVLLAGVEANREGKLLLWYYTPMMLSFSQHLQADCIVYDCMDELANFKFAPSDLLAREAQLLRTADLVFTGGYSLYEAKRDRHPSVHAFPSSVEREHFVVARETMEEPPEQRSLQRPRFGFYGVVDERMDLELLAHLADARPEWSILIVGPVVKIDPADLPARPNLHYLGGKSYVELPAHLAGWDVALMPFAINEATRFISPTKTPEYLSAGKPVVSTPITDVVRHYGGLQGVSIAEGADAFVAACDEALALARGDGKWLEEADALLLQTNWDDTVKRMRRLIDTVLMAGQALHPIVSPTIWPPEATKYDVMVVGAGFAGSVMAERLASIGKTVLVVDRRPHIAGNAYDRLDDAGLLIHQYGPHIFHTNSTEIFEYLSQFTEWRAYEHRVLAKVDGLLVPIPINRTTINILYGLDLRSEAEAEAFLASRAEPVPLIETSEDVVIAAVGRELYEKFFRDYTRKQWGLDPSQLDRTVTSRVPTRTDTDDRYFNDRFQAMPAEGYTKMFERMLDHPNIDLLLGTDYAQVRSAYLHTQLVFTGPIDEYFGYRFGKLPYRSLRFEHETIDTPWFQPVAVVNYPDLETPYTRITEYKHLTGHENDRTSITREYPQAEGDPYYPIPREENQALFKRYEALARSEENVTFVGRLATYRYYNMDQIVGQALASFRRTFLHAERAPGDRAIASSSQKEGTTSGNVASVA